MKCLVIALCLVAMPAATQRLDAFTEFPTIGRVKISAESSSRKPGAAAAIAISTGKRLLARFPFDMGRDETGPPPFPVRFEVVDVDGIEGPLVIAVAGSHGGSDASFETMVIAAREGGFVEVLTPHPDTNIPDAVCLTYAGPRRTPTILTAHFIWGAWHYAPRRYRVEPFAWNGTAFMSAGIRETRRQYESAGDAFAELGYCCRGDFTLLLVPDER